MAKTINAVLKAALEYAALGWRVFPILSITRDGGCECRDGPDCTKAGKHPAINAWNKEATTSRSQIESWWTEHPEWGVGIATGKESDLTILDVDGEEGVEELGKLATGTGMPPTPCVSSRPGRYHYYFAYEAGIKSKSKVLGSKHLDTRGDNGYVVAPPSRHSTGSVYKWVLSPHKVVLADWPEFLKEGAPKKRGRPSKEMFNPANPADVAKLVEALTFIDPDDEERWGQVGWIMGRAFRQSDEGFSKYSTWAGRSRKYDPKKTRTHYYETSKQIRGGDLKTTSSIFSWATEAGWDKQDVEAEAPRAYNIFDHPFKEQTMVEEFAAAAAASDRIYAMGMRLIHIVLYGDSKAHDPGVKRDDDSYIVWDHDNDTLAVEFGNIAAFWAHTDKGFKRAKFSRPAIQTFVACHRYGPIKQLLAFLPHPSLRADGTVISEVGYDAASKLYLTSKVAGLEIRDNLTQKQAMGAMKKLLEPFSEYPWATPADRAVFCAALFTVGLRHLFDIAPLFAFSSPKHGSGKTQLAECISKLWYGTTLSKATWTPNPEEMEKRIASFLLAGDRMVCLDNVSEGLRLEDSTLNKVLTSRKNTFRILGKTERVELTNEATWFATGNQLNLSGDIARRALICYIDAKVIDPSSRAFAIGNLPQHVLDNRGMLMSMALSIVSSWMAAGKPEGEKAHRQYGSFTSWYEMIRPLLLWAGEGDVAEAIDTVTEEDTEGAALEAYANALRKAMPPDASRLTLTGVMKLFGKDNELSSAFSGCMSGTVSNGPNHRTLSDLLRRCEHKIFISDNPGHKFTINKLKDARENSWMWGFEYLNQL